MRLTLSGDCTVTITEASVKNRACVRIVGELDTAAAPVLASSIRQLSRMSPERVVVDVADVTFAGSALPNFLATLHGKLPPGCSLVVRHPRPMLRRVLLAAGMTQIVSISDGPLDQ